MINVNDLRKAMQRPEIEMDGQVFRGHVLSWPRWSYWVGQLAVWYGGTLTDEEAKADIRAFFDDMGLPGDKLIELEAPIVQKVIADFFALHRQAFEQAAAAAPSN